MKKREDNLTIGYIFVHREHVKSEIYMEMKIAAVKPHKNFLCSLKKEIPLGYAIKLRNEQQGS